MEKLSEKELEIARAMTPAQKLRAAQWLNDSARQLLAAGFRMRHPEWTEAEIQRAVGEALLYGRT